MSKNLAAAALLVIAALPGLLPALEFVGGGNTKVESDAAYIQVAYRLAHHLDPMDVPWTAYACYAAMALFWFFVRRRAALLPGERWFTWFVAGSVLICLFGLLLGLRAGAIGDMPYWQLRTRLLKFYWFRLADGTVPLAASVGVVALVRQRLARGEVSATGKQSATDSSSLLMSRARCWGLSAIMSAVLAASLFLPSPDRSPPQFTPAQLADWKDVCRWIAAETPEGALFLTPTYGWGFKWYAQRPEFVTYKDVPQDAAGVVEWNNRLIALAAWTSENRNEAGGFRPGALERLQKTLKEHEPAGVDYIVSVDGMLGPFPLPVVYENETCRVYRWNDGP